MLFRSEILALHEASRECVWLRSVIYHIQNICGFSLSTGMPTPIFEDNAACITQVRGGNIKGDRTKHISPKFFYTHELQLSRQIDVKQIQIIWQICLLKYCLHQLLRNWYMELACVVFANYRIDIEVSFRGSVQSGGAKILK